MVDTFNQAKYPLPYRDYVVEFDVRTNAKELESNLKLQGCPSYLWYKVKEVATDYWNVFFEDGFRRAFWGFSFHVYTGNHPPIYCKPPR